MNVCVYNIWKQLFSPLEHPHRRRYISSFSENDHPKCPNCQESSKTDHTGRAWIIRCSAERRYNLAPGATSGPFGSDLAPALECSAACLIHWNEPVDQFDCKKFVWQRWHTSIRRVGDGKVFDILVYVYAWIILSTCHASLKHAALFSTWPILRYSNTQYSDAQICTYQSMSYWCMVSVSNEQSCLEVEYGVQVQTKANSMPYRIVVESWFFSGARQYFIVTRHAKWSYRCGPRGSKCPRIGFYRPFANMSKNWKIAPPVQVL